MDIQAARKVSELRPNGVPSDHILCTAVQRYKNVCWREIFLVAPALDTQVQC